MTTDNKTMKALFDSLSLLDKQAFLDKAEAIFPVLPRETAASVATSPSLIPERAQPDD